MTKQRSLINGRIEAHGLAKRYGDVVALDGLDLIVPEGTILGLLGPNGAGKTTAVSILTTLLQPDADTAVVAGANLATSPGAVRKRIGLSGQYAAVDENLTGYENLDMIGRLYHLGRKRAGVRARELLERFKLSDAGDRPVKTYSGGMRRRLDLAGALVAEPLGALPRRTDHRAGPAQSKPSSGRSSANSWLEAGRCCSQRSTWRRQTSWPTTSW